MDIRGVDCTILGVDEMAEAQRFCRDIGLHEQEGGASGATYCALDGTGVILRNARDPGLPAPNGPAVNARRTIWGVGSQAALDSIAQELGRDRDVTIDADGTVHAFDPAGFPISFRVTRRHDYAADVAILNTPGREPLRGRNRRIDFKAPVRPRSIGHIVFYVSDLPTAVAFYTTRLGFRVTNSYIGRSAFLRAQGSNDHHNLFMIQRPGQPGLHHIEYHVTDFEEVMRGGKLLTEKGWKTVYGPGRHVLGSNYYWYFNTPCGGAFELAADMDWVDDEWQAGEWDYTPDMVSAWQTSLVQSGHR